MKSVQEAAARAKEFHQLMLGVAGHDLRTPLGAIAICAEVLARDPSAVQKVVPRLRRSTERATAVLEALLDVTQHQLGGGLRLNRDDCDLAKLVREVVGEFEGGRADRTVRVREEGQVIGSWDRTRLGQVVSNLVSNALQHGEGDVSVTVGGDRGDLTVANSSRPLPAELVDTLFEPFRRAHGASREKGIGLGLYIVKQIVDAHGGDVRAAYLDGSLVVTVTLPRTAA